MATFTNNELIAQIYIGFYDRAPDPEGLKYWVGRLEAGVSVQDIGDSFAASPEAKSVYPYFNYPGILSPADFLNQVYQNVFGRPIDPDGLAYYQGRMESGESAGSVVASIIGNASTNDGSRDQIYLQNKVDVGLDWAHTAAGSSEIPGVSVYEADGVTLTESAAASAHEVIKGVDETPASVVEGMAETAAYFVPTFELTKGDDHFTGTDGNDNFNAPLTAAIDGLVGAQTLQGSDVLDGGDGYDTLNAELNGTGTTANPTLSGIEALNLTSVYGLAFGSGGPGVLDLSRATGVEEINNVNSQNDLEVFGIQAPADIGMDGVAGGNYFDVEYGNDVVVDTQNVSVENTGSAGTGSAWLNIYTNEAINTMNLEVSNSYVDVDADVSGLGSTLNLDVADGVVIDLGADGAENLNISGSGSLDIEGENDFAGLVHLDATEFDDDLNIDVGGSTVLESVATGGGNDRVEINHANFADGDADGVGDISVDLGAGENVLAVDSGGWWDLNDSDINGLDFTGGVSNVQTLEFDDRVDLGGDATLDLDGFDVAPARIEFADLEANGYDFTIANAGADLTLSSADDFDMDGGKLTTDGVVHLTVESTGTVNSDVDLDGSVSGDVLETLTANATDDADVALTTADELTALKNVSVNAADDASLSLTGTAGTKQVNGVHQTQTITVDVSAAYNGGLSFTNSASGTFNFNSSSLFTGVLAAGYSESASSFITGPNSSIFDEGAASDLATALNGSGASWPGAPSGNAFTAAAAGNQVVVTWADFGNHEAIHYTNGVPSHGSINSVTASAPTTNVLPVDMVPGTGYEALETVHVNGGDDASVNLKDVYGHFALDVNAGSAGDVAGGADPHNATVDLFNTEVTTVTVTATDDADVTIGGDTIGARSLTSVDVTAHDVDLQIGSNGLDAGVGNDFSSLATVTVAGDTADVTLGGSGLVAGEGGNFSAFQTLDVSQVATYVTVDTSEANFHQVAGQVVTYDIGATQNGNIDIMTDYANAIDVDMTANAAREVFSFVGNNIGEVEINDFTAGADPATGDRIDLSHFANIHSAGDLIFTDNGGDLYITDVGGDDFGGSIVLVGLGGDAADVSAFNIMYA